MTLLALGILILWLFALAAGLGIHWLLTQFTAPKGGS